jgi:NAD(P)-dependent dehydrogenase (short-subunit alcohol dehydrogenase family)
MLKGKLIVITGGAGLLGREFVKAIVQNGGIAVIADINLKSGIKLKEQLSEELKTDKIDFVKLDTTSKVSLKKCIDYLDNNYGRIDALVNNAYPKNKNYGRSFFDVEYKDFVENIGLNLGGFFIAIQQFSNYFKKQGSGNIVNICSIYGVIPPKFEIYKNTPMTMPVEYAAIKSGLIHMTKYLSKYFKGLNIKVNALSPGGILDNQPNEFLRNYNNYGISKGMLENQDINGTLIYLLSDMSEYVNGQNIIVDDGWSL